MPRAAKTLKEAWTMAGLTDAGARSVLETLTWQRARIAELEALLRRALPHIGSNRVTAYDDEKTLRAEIEVALSN